MGARIESSVDRQPVIFFLFSFLVCIREVCLQRVVALLGCISGRVFRF